jgi:murein DD-endopeptidase MepM/ murein hydrolase activator NlpD
MHTVDDSFKKKRDGRLLVKRRRKLRRRLSFAAILFAASCCMLLAVFWFHGRLGRGGNPVDAQDQTTEIIVPTFVPTIVDLPGDPIHIELEALGRGSTLRSMALPPSLAAQGLAGQVRIMSERIIETGQRLAATVPSTQQDFAFFQSQRSAAALPNAGEPRPAESQDPATAPLAETASGHDALGTGDPAKAGSDLQSSGWGDTAGAEGLGPEEEFKRTEIENNVSVLNLTPEINRAQSSEDVFVHVVGPAEMSQFLRENGVNVLDARLMEDALKSAFGFQDISQGSIVAMRQLKVSTGSNDRKLVQVAIYLPDKFLGALALSDKGRYEASVDPWSDRDLFERAINQKDAVTSNFRLLDGIYSAGIRHGVPPSIVGEAIMYLSRKHDLSDLAGSDDRMTLIYSDKPRNGGESPGRVLYVSIEQTARQLNCFVFKPSGANDFSCLDEHDQSSTVETINEMVTPVAGGVLTSTFGPRMHPILKKILLHAGVDWAAPIGTPVRAAFAGSIVFLGEKGGYGNFVRLSHEDGRDTGYAHLSAFAKNAKVGQSVKAGDVIGFVGTTGRSTGPHLHFELYAGGTTIDPLETETRQVSAEPDSVNILVNKIIKVESAGSATAKNPLSSATGLGQFINSTWLRMIRTYRPDLAGSLSAEKQLELRFDPTLSREMTTHLARENKAYLESAGHSVSAGSLYLAHFLGPAGARLVLDSRDDSDLQILLGDSVISANKFLTGHDVAWIKNWSSRKMSGPGYAAPAPAPVVKTTIVEQASPEFAIFRETLIALAKSP